MKLREFFLSEDDDQPSNGVPTDVNDDEEGSGPSGEGDLSNGIPQPVGSQGRKMRAAGQASAKTQSVPISGRTQELPTDYVAPRFPSTNAGDNPMAVRAGQRQGSKTGITPVGPDSGTRQVPIQGAPPKVKASPPGAQAAMHPWGSPMDWNGELPDLPQEGRLGEMFGLTEMPRPKGSLGPSMKAVLSWASQQKQPFTARQAFQVFRDNGGMPNVPRDKDTMAYMSFQTALKKLSVPDGSRPNEYQPLMIFRQGTRRADDPTLYRWGSKSGYAATSVTRNPSKAPPPKQVSPLQKPKPSAPSNDFDTEEPTNPGMNWSFDDQGNPVEPQQGDEDFSDLPDLDQFFPGEEPGEETQAQPSAAADEEEPDEFEDEPEEPKKGPFWLPQPDPDGSGAEMAIAQLQTKGLGPNNQLWRDIARCDNGSQALALIRKTGPEMFRQKKLVARYILSRLDKPIDDLIG